MSLEYPALRPDGAVVEIELKQEIAATLARLPDDPSLYFNLGFRCFTPGHRSSRSSQQSGSYGAFRSIVWPNESLLAGLDGIALVYGLLRTKFIPSNCFPNWKLS
ncbi:hypothetical protein DEU52_13314 [Ensifer adhaerens]|nr:hypothetical protein DEU52_13314 [Ensifer adhaerens]